jgi:hypothetical protein
MDAVYEYVFVNEFDINIFNNGPVSNDEFLIKVRDQVQLMANILLYNQGIPTFTSLITFNNQIYKITVKRG